MAAPFVNLDRLTPMFLPCDLRDWVPADHIAHFILEAVEQIPADHFQVNQRGTGSEQYPLGWRWARTAGTNRKNPDWFE